MKKSTSIVFLLLASKLVGPTESAAQWTQTNGYYAKAFVSAGSSLFMGSRYNGIYSSTNDGSSWVSANTGLTTSDVRALVSNSGYLFAGTYGGGVFISSDNGANWTAVNTGLTNLNVLSVAAGGGLLFAGTNGGGAFVSYNNGASWFAASNGLSIPVIQALVFQGGYLFAGTGGGGVCISNNNGASWTPVNSGLTNLDVRALMVSGSNLFAGTYGGGIFVTANLGVSWTSTGTGLTNSNVLALCATEASLFAGTDGGGVFRSGDGGAGWYTVNTGLGVMNVNAIISSGAYLLAGTNGGVFRRLMSEIVPPVISSITPSTAMVGASVTVSGSNFSTTPSNNVVYFGSVRATVTSAATNSLTVTVPAGATYAPVTVTIGRLTGYSPHPFQLTFDGGGLISTEIFGPQMDWSTMGRPSHAAIGDFDADGKPDLAISHVSSGYLMIYRNLSTAGSLSFAGNPSFGSSSNTKYIATGDLDGDGKLDVVLTNYAANTISVYRNISQPGIILFEAKVDFWAGPSPFQVAIRDLDGDGKADLVVGNDVNYTLTIIRNTHLIGSFNGSSFAAGVGFITTSTPRGIAICDLDGDGKPDLAATNINGNTISILRNTGITGNITFASKVDFSTGQGPSHVAIGDLDGDEKPDLAIANSEDNSVSVLRNISTAGSITSGSFDPKVDFTASATSVSIGDMNGDEKPDLIANKSNQVSLLQNTTIAGGFNADSFAPRVISQHSYYNMYGVVGDLDGDGKPDCVNTKTDYSQVSILRNLFPEKPQEITLISPNGGENWGVGSSQNITWTSLGTSGYIHIEYSTNGGSSWADVIASTLDDGSYSWIVPEAPSTNGLIRISDTDGTPSDTSDAVFTISILIPGITEFTPGSGTIGTSVVITGFNFSADTDSNIVYFGAVRAPVTSASLTSLNVVVPAGATYAPITVTVGGRIAYSADPFLVTFAGGGSISDSSFAPRLCLGTAGTPNSVAVGDFNGDGKSDMAITNNDNNYVVSIYRNRSVIGSLTDSSFAAKMDLATADDHPYDATIADIDGDGKLDLAIANMGVNSFSVFRNTSTVDSISFAARVDFATNANPYCIAVADIDGDGKPDLAALNTGSDNFSAFRNSSTVGHISFAEKVDFPTCDYPFDIAMDDLDGDGKPDAAVTNYNSNTVSVLQNMSDYGSISFASKVDFNTDVTPVYMVIGDLDMDGKPDLAINHNSRNRVTVMRNTSVTGSITSASFADEIEFITAAYPYGIAVGDLDGDGKPDLMPVCTVAKSVSVFKNTSTEGAISLAANIDFGTGVFPIYPAIADLDGDGRSDIVVGDYTDQTISLWRNKIGSVFCRIKNFLEGSYQPSGSMTTYLKTSGSVPLTSPYPDGRTVTSVPDGVTDWVSVELRTSASGESVVQRSFFQKSDGNIVDMDGATMNLEIPGAGDGDYFIVVRHRNHGAVMSVSAQSLNVLSPDIYDFSTGQEKYHGTGGAKQLEAGVWGMWAGDVNQDKNVTTTDYTSWYNSARLGESGYKATDLNMDGVVTTSDYTMWYNNARLGAASQVP
ncbi:VCBS repeat-containing protein [bacterium]|nr:VCBS repeat-containing protein [bacterium]